MPEVKHESSALSLRRSTRKRKLDIEDIDEESRIRSRSTKRDHESPETDAHLKGLSDHLSPNLDVIFCGMNPGKKSALVGQYFVSPTNHFWRCLHRSGFTPRILFPPEDATLPSQFNLGLTCLLEEPSAGQAKHSKEQMRQSVPALKAKILAHRPHIVCFVGKGTWVIFGSALESQARGIPIKSDCDEKILPSATPLSPKPPFAKSKATSKVDTFNWGLQPYKFVYPSQNNGPIKLEKTEDIDLSSVSETLLFVMPNTSGRVVSHQLNDKVKLFARLREDLAKAKAKMLDTSSMTAIPLI